MEAAVDDDAPPDENALYRHTKRDEWGVAVFMWERDGKRCFRFSDGEVRTFKEGFYKLMVPTAAPADGSADKLRAQVLAGSKKIEIVPTVGDQLVLLLRDYPKGFAGDAWRSKHRGGGRRLKRHRDAAITEARKLLAPSELAELHEAGDYAGVLARLADVLRNTDLVPGPHVKKIESTKPNADVSGALVAMARDPERATLRGLQAGFVSAAGPANSWQVLTAPLTLLAPDAHLCVRPSVFGEQGKIVQPRFNPPSRASEANYQRYLEIARSVRNELTELGHPPADLLDVYDFTWTTLRPAAREELERIHLQRKNAGTSTAQPSAAPGEATPEASSEANSEANSEADA